MKHRIPKQSRNGGKELEYKVGMGSKRCVDGHWGKYKFLLPCLCCLCILRPPSYQRPVENFAASVQILSGQTEVLSNSQDPLQICFLQFH